MEDTSYIQVPLTKPFMYDTLGNRLKYLADEAPEKTAFILCYDDGKRDIIKRVEIYKKSFAFARGLLKIGLSKGDFVGVSFPNDINWLVSVFGCILIGVLPFFFKTDEQVLRFPGKCVGLILDSTNHKGTNMKAILKETKDKNRNLQQNSRLPNLKFIVAMNEVTNSSVGIYRYSDIADIGDDQEANFPIIDPDDIVVMLTTSGSTGLPKCVSKTHIQMLNYGENSAFMYRMNDKDVYFNDRLFTWIGGFPIMYLVCGSIRVMPTEFFPHVESFHQRAKFIMSIMAVERCTVAKLLAMVVLELLKLDNPKRRLRVISIGGYPIPKTCAQLIGRFADAFVSHYGSTEQNPVLFKYIEIESEFSDFVAGKPPPGMEIKVVDKYGRTVGKNEMGELLIRNPRAFSGYYKDQRATEEVLDANGWFKSDDSCYMNDDGDYVINGRLSDIMQVYGAIITKGNDRASYRQTPSCSRKRVLLHSKKVHHFIDLAFVLFCDWAMM